ncbi:phosphotransferase [Streptomyces sp. NBC_00414]|uniref:phosphotransferase n=1 Tax=Streptomyces sp. NBC_00414 TaxID=2975739 RepID=UPI002E237BDB
MGDHARIGGLVGSGRRADVYAYESEGDGTDGAGGGAWVLRRYRDGVGDASFAADVMEYVHGHGYPVPRVWPRATESRADLVMERLSGPTLLGAMAAGEVTAAEGAGVLARLLGELHAIPARVSGEPGARVLHLDLHPDNVLLTPGGPMVIDWDNTEEGPPGLDWGMSAVLLAQVAVVEGHPHAAGAGEVLAALLAGCRDSAVLTGVRRELGRALERRAVDPATGPAEVGLLGDVERLIRGLLGEA